MNLLEDIIALHDRWDCAGGISGSDRYEDALYRCINELADVIIKHEKAATQPDDKLCRCPASHIGRCRFLDDATCILRCRDA